MVWTSTDQILGGTTPVRKRERKNSMTTEEAKRSISYSRIVTDVMALQLRDGYIDEMFIANRRN